jgi:hypothetical protein
VFNFTNTIIETAKVCIPNRTVKIRPRDKPWFNKTLRKLFRERDRCHKCQKRTNNPIHIDLFKQKRKEATDAYRQAKYDYYSNITIKLQDPTRSSKSYWHLIKHSMGEFKTSRYGRPRYYYF